MLLVLACDCAVFIALPCKTEWLVSSNQGAAVFAHDWGGLDIHFLHIELAVLQWVEIAGPKGETLFDLGLHVSCVEASVRLFIELLGQVYNPILEGINSN